MIILFYSQQCQHSKNAIMAVQKSSLQNDIKMFCIDGFKPLPSYLTHVPTMKIYSTNTLLVGEKIDEWLETQKPAERIEDQVAQSTGSYTMLDGGDMDDVNEIDSAYNSRISTPQGQVPSQDGPTTGSSAPMSSSGGGGSNFPSTAKMQTNDGLDMAYEQMVAERSYGGTNGVARI